MDDFGATMSPYYSRHIETMMFTVCSILTVVVFIE